MFWNIKIEVRNKEWPYIYKNNQFSFLETQWAEVLIFMCEWSWEESLSCLKIISFHVLMEIL